MAQIPAIISLDHTQRFLFVMDIECVLFEVQTPFFGCKLDERHYVHESVYRVIIMNTTNEMQLYRLIYYS